MEGMGRMPPFRTGAAACALAVLVCGACSTTVAHSDAAPDSADPTVAGAATPSLAPLARRLQPDVLVRTSAGFDAGALARLAAAAPEAALPLREAPLRLDRAGGTTLDAVAAEPARFRAFTPRGTAEATDVWNVV